MKPRAPASKINKLLNTQKSIGDCLDGIILAQNKSGVLTMTLLQLLMEKGLFTLEEIETRLTHNEGLALDEDGGCQIPLSQLIIPQES